MDVGYSDFKNDNTVIACDLECSNDGTYNANNTWKIENARNIHILKVNQSRT